MSNLIIYKSKRGQILINYIYVLLILLEFCTCRKNISYFSVNLSIT
ncbi:unnamed protein product [Tenebrio molitor]|nr:unnamed protein product [Tenebrio molitor]